MKSKFANLVTGDSGTGEDDFFEIDATAGVEELDELAAEVYGGMRDIATGDVSPQGMRQLLALSNLKPRGNPAQAVMQRIAAIRARAKADAAKLRAMARTVQHNTQDAFVFDQLGLGVPIPAVSVTAPRGQPAFFLGFGAEDRTIRSIGAGQISYATVPLIDYTQTPAYTGVAGFNWTPLVYAMSQYHCNDRTCQPRLVAGTILFPTTPLILTPVQTAAIGPDAAPFQSHSIAIYCVSALKCNDEMDNELQDALSKYDRQVRRLYSMHGNVGSFVAR